MQEEKIKEFVRKRYSKIAKEDSRCCSASGPCGTDAVEHAKRIGYSKKELQNIPESAIMGLGCGNPTALAELKEGETVLDLGSGADLGKCALAYLIIGYGKPYI